MIGIARVSAIIVVALSMALTGCSINNASGGNCVPRIQIEPATIHPGDSITVVSTDKCNVKVPGKGWAVVAGHVGDEKALAEVKSSDTFDGSFGVKLTLPVDFPIGEAYGGVNNWDYSTCGDTESCAGPMGSFTVKP